MTPLIPIIGLVGGGVFAYKRAKKKKGLTPQRQQIYQSAIKNEKDPEKLKTLATAFDKEGMKPYGDELRKRAALRSMPPAQQQAYGEAFAKGMTSQDPSAVHRLADAFHAKGAYGAAQHLRDYAKGLSSKVASIFHHHTTTPPAAETPPPPPPEQAT